MKGFLQVLGVLFLIVIAIVIVLVAVGAFENVDVPGLWEKTRGRFESLAERKPQPQIVGRESFATAPGLDYTTTIRCTVRNDGAAGNVRVVAEVQKGGHWQRSRTVYMGEGQTLTVDIAFPEARWLADLSYRVWVEIP